MEISIPEGEEVIFRLFYIDGFCLKAALERFSLSCCGYTVAMYVLGIGDRHNDNIMLKTNGKVIFVKFIYVKGLVMKHDTKNISWLNFIPYSIIFLFSLEFAAFSY